jgi:hypothetical protein
MQPDRSRSPSPSPSPDSAPTSDEDVGSLKVKLDLLQMDAASSRTRAERGAAASCASFIDDLRGHYAPTQFGHGSSSDSTLPFYATSGTLGTVAACGSSGTGGLGGWKKGASARVSSTSNHGDSGWSSDFYSDERTQTIVAAPAPAPVPCTDFGRFRPQYEIGEGSFATVWKGVDVSNQRVVAMKYVRLRPRYRTDSEPQAELSEAQLTALLRHANVVELLDSRIILPSRTETLIYEFLPDGDLFNGLEKGDVDESECKEYMLQVTHPQSLGPAPSLDYSLVIMPWRQYGWGVRWCELCRLRLNATLIGPATAGCGRSCVHPPMRLCPQRHQA